MMNTSQSAYQTLADALGTRAVLAEERAIEVEARERGVPEWQVRIERLRRQDAERAAERERVNALVNDQATLAALRQQWASRPINTPRVPPR